jgi:hypothetical protein
MARGSADQEIHIHHMKEPSERARSLMLIWFRGTTARHPNLSQLQRKSLLENVATIVMYDLGYKEPRYYKQLLRNWESRVIEYFKTGTDAAPLQTKNKGKQAYNDMIEAQFPCYIHKVYRHTVKKYGSQLPFKKMAEIMNRLSQEPEYNDKPDLTLTKSQLWRHFKQFRGKLKSPLEKPYKTADQKRQTLEKVREMKRLKRRKGHRFHICFIDEKWFYTQSRRKKSKHLPPHPNGDEDDDGIEEFVRTTISRRHPIKVRWVLIEPAKVDCYVFFSF